VLSSGDEIYDAAKSMVARLHFPSSNARARARGTPVDRSGEPRPMSPIWLSPGPAPGLTGGQAQRHADLEGDVRGERARVETGESVLVLGASGGVGQASVQLAMKRVRGYLPGFYGWNGRHRCGQPTRTQSPGSGARRCPARLLPATGCASRCTRAHASTDDIRQAPAALPGQWQARCARNPRRCQVLLTDRGRSAPWTSAAQC
jgi:hypothetical protein